MAKDYGLVLESILSAAASALNEADRKPGRVEMVHGLLPAWDDCCSGQLYLRVIEIYPSLGKNSPFPQIDVLQAGVAGGPCAIHGLAIHFGLGVIRCTPTVDGEGNAPTPADVTLAALGMLEDMSTLLDVLVCTVQKEVEGFHRLKMDRWVPQGAEGGCAGGEWGAYIAVDPCFCA